MRMFLAALGLLVSLPLAGHGADTREAYDLLFRTGTLDAVEREAALVYARDVEDPRRPEAAMRDSGRIEIGFEQDGDGPESAVVTFHRDGKYKKLGEFPARVGNPLIMLFHEFMVRDMAENAGGSPFYIRNRIKEALVREVPVAAGTAVVGGAEVPVRRVTLKPFEGDPNAGRMGGFEALTMTATMSESVPGWYLSLVAEVPGEGGPAYRSAITYQGLEAAE